MTNRDMHAEVMRTLEGMRTKLDGVESLAKDNKEHLRRISPQVTVQPVPRPKQGTQLSRGASVTKYLREYTKEKNSGIPEGKPRYDEFSEDIQDKQYNTDAMNTLEWILGLHLGSNLGVLTWEQVCKKNPGKMGLIIRDAVSAPDLRVFAQAAGQWAIQMLITNKMNSRIRYNRERRAQETAENEVTNFAPMNVPDLVHEESLPEINPGAGEEYFEEIGNEPEYFEQGVDHNLHSLPTYDVSPPSFVADNPPDEALYRHSTRRTLQQRRIPPINRRASPDANSISHGDAIAGPVVWNGTRRGRGANMRVNSSRGLGARARGRGTRVSRAASTAAVRGISRPSRARRGSSVANRRGTNRKRG